MDRKDGIGGSDSPVILGVSPFKDKLTLWGQKRGTLPPEPETPAMQRGKYLEPVVAELYEKATGRKLIHAPDLKVHPEYSWMNGHIDRFVYNCIPEFHFMAPCEIKCPGLRVFNKCQREGVPEYYMVQLQHYMAITEQKWGALAVFNAEKWELIFFDVNRDDDLINIIIVKDAEFWQMVQDGRAPTETANIVIDLPKVEPSEIYTLDTPDWAHAVKYLRDARALKAEVEVMEEEAKVKLQELMGGHPVVEGAGARIYWKDQAGRKTVDSKLLQAKYPEIYKEVTKIGAPSKPFKPFFLKETYDE